MLSESNALGYGSRTYSNNLELSLSFKLRSFKICISAGVSTVLFLLEAIFVM